MKYKIIFIALLCLGVFGCTNVKTLVMGTGYANYQEKNTEIEKAYKDGEITKAEYLDLKRKNKQIYQETWPEGVEIKK
ncbi:MAG: hypothetical protein WC412_08605 [Candidatus Omnitrophota bacterium]|jgi:hypothetical protein